MIQLKSLLLAVSLAVLCMAADKPTGEGKDPYSIVGLCRKDLLDKSDKDFNIVEIANTGDYNYLYLTGYTDTACASAEIHGDDVIGFRGSASRTDSTYKTAKVSYSLNVVSPGVINETFVGKDSRGKTVTNYYKLIVTYWDKDLGVFAYIRCSDYGTSDTDSRSIVVRACNSYGDTLATATAKTIYNSDSLFEFKGGPLHSIKVCTK